ncbi:hypothetical protein WA538_004315, partial [Blastocystis sp. DL]
MSTPIDVSQKKYTRNTERFIRDITSLKQEILALSPYMEAVMANPTAVSIKRIGDISNHIDDLFSTIYNRLADIKFAKDQLQQLKDKADPRCDLFRWLFISMPIQHFYFAEQREKQKVNLIIIFDYASLFSVKLTTRVKGSMCKTKDIQIYGIREIRSSPYSNELTNPRAMSSILLFRQMTAAAKRFLFSLPSHRNKNVLDVLRWLTNYDNLYSARCVICHSQMPLTGSDAFCVPSLRHFDTGAPYHPSCCTGETLLR